MTRFATMSDVPWFAASFGLVRRLQFPTPMCLLFAIALVAAVASGPAVAETRALLIGVSDYNDDLGLDDLRGPSNDVRLLNETLTAIGVRDITLLADGIEGAGATTRASIAAAFADLAATAKAGQTVFIHFSGHGTRQRDPDGDEGDGLDEVFLPSDTKPAEPGVGLIRNAIVDDELGRWVDAIRRTGADVWLSIDSCHAGTGLRDPSPHVASRFIDPARLGARITGHSVPPAQPTAEALEVEAPTGGRAARADQSLGGIMAFYAAQSSEVAREVNFGALADAERKAKGPWYGLFTSRLAKGLRLAADRGFTFRELFQSILADLNAVPLPRVAKRQTPSWEGTMATRSIFPAHGGGPRAQRFAVDGATLAAGQVEGVTRGSLVALYEDETTTAPIGRAQVRNVGLREAQIAFVDDACDVRAQTLCDPLPRAITQKVRFGRMIAQARGAPIAFSKIESGPGVSGDVPAQLQRAVEQALDTFNAEAIWPVQIVPDAEAADVRVAHANGQLWFGETTDVSGAPAGASWSPTSGIERLVDLIARIARAEQTARRLTEIAAGGSILNPNPIAVRASVQPSDRSKLAPRSGIVDPAEECGAIFDAGAFEPEQILSADKKGRMKQCDLVDVSVQGLLPGGRDVNLVYIDANYCVTNQYKRLEAAVRPERIGDGFLMCSDCPDGYSAGRERVFVIIGEVLANRETLNLTGQVETCAPAKRTRSANAGETSLNLFGDGGFGTTGKSAEMIWVQRFSWLVVPRDVVFSEVKAE